MGWQADPGAGPPVIFNLTGEDTCNFQIGPRHLSREAEGGVPGH